MKLPLILIFLILFNSSDAIFNGDETSLHQFPFVVALRSRIPSPLIPRFKVCGGSVISRISILTSAFCVTGVQSTVLYLGVNRMGEASEQFQLSISTPQISILVHPSYSAPVNDVALVKLTTPIGFFNHAVNLVYLPNNQAELFDGLPAYTFGFGQDTPLTTGATNTETLLKINTGTLSNSACNPSFTTLQPSQICADAGFDSGICLGDEGGPLVIVRNGRYVQIGINQVFSDGSLIGGCNIGLKVFTRITNHLDWIQANM